ncbi:lipase member H-A-like [Lycorma delicatula]|uniref:lipase member H-A-like n=1 Tax=Lycorma delicatula TaxID=130591 RepID=UPI003F50D801
MSSKNIDQVHNIKREQRKHKQVHLTHRKHVEGIEVNLNDKSYLLKVNFEESFETVILIQGYKHADDIFIPLKDAYMKSSGMLINVIIVQWKILESPQPVTTLTIRNIDSIYIAIDIIGKFIAEFINKFIDTFKAVVSDIHLIGIGLGCHVAGYAAVSYLCLFISGLDPSQPSHIVKWDKDIGLSKDSAKFVDVMHTSIGEQGINKNLGTVDFYVNGGTAPQPGCWQSDGGCSHRRALLYYIEALKGMIIGAPCKSYTLFKTGECCDTNKMISFGDELADIHNKDDDIQYYLNTNSVSPFGLGIEGQPRICLEDKNSKEGRAIDVAELLVP